MAKRKRQESTYIDDELGERLDDVSEEANVSKAQILRDGLRRQLDEMEKLHNLESGSDD